MEKQKKSQKNYSIDPESGEIPTPCLEIPTGRKRWSSDLIKIVDREKEKVFDTYDFSGGQLTKSDLNRTLQKMRACGSLLELRASLDRDSGEMGDPAIHAGNYCGQHSICPFCAARVQDRRKARFKDSIHLAANSYQNAYILTVTLPPTETWRENLNALETALGSFRKMGQKRKGRKANRSSGEWGKIKAGLGKIEIKRGEGSGLPHCHVHLLVFTNEALNFRVWSKDEKLKPREERECLFEGNQSKISMEWNVASLGLGKGVNVQRLKFKAPKQAKGETDKHYRERSENWSLGDSIFEQSREVLKYATKFESNPETEAENLFASDFISIRSATFRKRLFRTYGDFRKIGGNDYEGSQYPLSSKPILYSARWNTNKSGMYGPLTEIKKSIFPNSESGLTAQYQRVRLGRALGKISRVRTAINKAKRKFLDERILEHAAFVVDRKWLDEGGFTESVLVLEMPESVLNDPYDLDNWEAWQDECTERARMEYNSVKEDLSLESHERMVGTIEERNAQKHFEDLVYWNSAEYKTDAVDLILETLRQ